MNEEDMQDARRAGMAKAIKLINDQWTHELELIAVKARLAHARYEALLKAGFPPADALAICHKPIDF